MDGDRTEHLETADTELIQICASHAKEKYGEILPDSISKRLKVETDNIVKNGYAAAYMTARKFVKLSNDDGYVVGSRGCLGASLVAYLLGITEVDPIKFNIPYETLMGLDGNKAHDIELNVSDDYWDDNCCRLNITHDHRDSHGNSIHITIIKNNAPTMINALETLTGVISKSIPIDDETTLKMLMNADTLFLPGLGDKLIREMIRTAKPESFDDFVAILGLASGTGIWEDNAECLIESGRATISEVVAHRDDIMLSLMAQGVDRERAYDIMESVRRGNGISNEHMKLLSNCDLPEWYIDSCKKIAYLFPKAHSVAYMIVFFRIAWYKAHYPDVFRKIVESKL